jgi:probable F420-dependent oxidoreductase
MVPLFDPGPIDHPDIPIHVSGIGPSMCALAGEVAEGLRLHPVCTARYIDEVARPAVDRGAARVGRDPGAIELCMKPLVATAPDAAALERVVATVRERVGFYLSTPSYRPAFAVHGWGDIAVRASELSRARRWDELAGLVTDEMLHTVAAIGTHDEIAAVLRDRYVGRVSRVEFSLPVEVPADVDRLRRVLAELRR